MITARISAFLLTKTLRRNGDGNWPAYDLTLCAEGYNGEHTTSVNGTGKPRLSDFIEVGAKTKLRGHVAFKS